jgi:predicted Rossmann fold flavoprotein
MAAYDLIVVGGGPAGMMAAGRAAERGRCVLMLERGGSPGRKLLLTGNGRCNVTNSAPLQEFVRALGRGGGFLHRALGEFGPDALRAWLRGRGVPTIEEEGGRVFPLRGGAQAVLDALRAYMAASGVEVRTGQRVEALRIESGRAAGVRTEGGEWRAPHVLVATGGLSYPRTGSTGDGYALARSAGHTVLPPYPAIVPLETAETWPAGAQGTALRDVALRVIAVQPGGRERTLARTRGDVLCTHFGLSGPTVLDASSEAVRALARGMGVALELDLAPDAQEDALARELAAPGASGPLQMKTVVARRLPQYLAPVIVELAGLEPSKLAHACSDAERRALVGALKRLRLTVTRPRPLEEAYVTGGGVALGEVDERRMESRLAPGLHFAGEVLDLQGPSGGYNLQTAFATGRLAGESV